MGENICKSYISDKALKPGYEKTHTTQQPKNKQPNLKMGKEIEQTQCQRKYANSQ